MTTEQKLQPMPPQSNRDEPDTVIFMVLRDLTERAMFGKQKYKTFLKTHNNRKALQDLYEEILDSAMYCKQLLMEMDDNVQKQAD